MVELFRAEPDKPQPRLDERRVSTLAARQHGLIATRQLAELGFSGDAVLRRVRAGRLHRIHRGVYSVGYRIVSFDARCLAAVLAAGSGDVLSHVAAGASWGLRVPPRGPLDVTTVRPGRRGPRGIILHRARHPPEHTTLRGIPITTVRQTLLDLAATRPRAELERAVREAQARRLITRDALVAFVEHAAGRPGAPALRAALGLAVTRSGLERRFLALCERAGLERPLTTETVAGLEVDFFWPDLRLVVETDAYGTHVSRHAFERDRERDAILARAAYRVLRFSDRQIDGRPGEVVATLAAMRVER